MLEGGIIAKLLDEKWTTYAKVGDYIENNLFHWDCTLSSVYMDFDRYRGSS